MTAMGLVLTTILVCLGVITVLTGILSIVFNWMLNPIKTNQAQMEKEVSEVKENQVRMEKEVSEVKENQVRMEKEVSEVKENQVRMEKEVSEVKENQVRMEKEIAEVKKAVFTVADTIRGFVKQQS